MASTFRTRGALALALALAPVGCLAPETDAPPAPPEELGEVSQELVVCPGDDVVRGIDVSYYQGDIDWEQVAGAGYRYAIARVSHSTVVMDTKFTQNWAGIAEVGMIRGAYQYFEPNEDPVEQAQIVCDAVGVLGEGDLPATIDVEVPDPGVTQQQYVDVVAAWIEHVEACTGKKPIIYTGKYYWEPNLGTDEFADHPLWHAAYPTACQPPNSPPSCGSCPNIADQWETWAFWQYTSSNTIPGIAGNVDTNVFNGTEADLLVLAGGGSFAGAIVSIEAPATVLAGERFAAAVTIENVGGASWTADTMIGTTEPRDRASDFADVDWPTGDRAAAVEGTIPPGASYTFVIPLTAPAEPGTYVEHFGLVQEGQAWFADEGGPADDAIALSFQVITSQGEGTGASGGGSAGDDDGGAGGSSGDAAEPDDGSCAVRGTGARAPSAAWIAAFGLALGLGVRRSARRRPSR